MIKAMIQFFNDLGYTTDYDSHVVSHGRIYINQQRYFAFSIKDDWFEMWSRSSIVIRSMRFDLNDPRVFEKIKEYVELAKIALLEHDLAAASEKHA